MAQLDSMFHQKYDEFISDLMGALPEYTTPLQAAAALHAADRLEQYKPIEQLESTVNPGCILPGVTITDKVWKALSEKTKKAIWEHIRVISMCHVMESGFTQDKMDDMMKNMKNTMGGADFQKLLKKFMEMFKKDTDDESGTSMPDFASFFDKGIPSLPERFLKGHLVRLAQEIVKDIRPEDLGLDAEMVTDCEKDPSRAFHILYTTFTNQPDLIQKVIATIGNRLQQKMKSGSIRMEEIAREAEELIKEFSDHPSFVEMMEGIKKAFGFEDMGLAKKAGKEGSARLAVARERLRKKLAKRNAGK